MQRSPQHQTVWREGCPVPSFQPIIRDERADVCIVGGGIAGLTAGYFLSKAGKKVILLEKEEIASGESSRTTAHITNALDDRYIDLIKYHGEENARMAAESHTRAIEIVEKIVKEEKIECDFERLPGYLFLFPGESQDLLKKELEAAHGVGLSGVSFLEDSPIHSYDMGQSLKFPQQGQFHPLRYLIGLAKAIEEHGGIIHTHSSVTSVDEHSPMKVRCQSGETVEAKAVIIATNAPVIDNALIYGKQGAYRSYVIAGPVPKDSVPRALFWDTGPYSESDIPPYHYVRIHPQKEKDILIVGGEDHKTGQANDGEARFGALEEWTRPRFPMMESVTHRWSGQVMEPADGLAMIGKKPGGNSSLYIATGDSGNGMTHGTIAGLLLSDLILEKENPWAALYAPSRIRAVKETLKETMNVAKYFSFGWLKHNARTKEKILKGEGIVTRRGVKKIAIYRDDDGALHTCSAVCPHRQCIVAWNSFEKSWDCPCHGSRFDRFGKILNGPARGDLPKVEE